MTRLIFSVILSPLVMASMSAHGVGGGHVASAPSRAVVAKAAPTAKNAAVAKPAATAVVRSARPVIAQPAVVVVNHYNNSIWWGGGLYLGAWYGPGWYYPGLLYPGIWYWNGWLGFQYGYSPYLSASGIKFDLSQVKSADRKTVSDAGVYLPDSEGKTGYLGKVGNFEKKLQRSLPLAPGTYDLTIALADGRELNMSVMVQPQRVTHVSLRLDQPPPQATSVPSNNQILTPAPPPNQSK